MKCILKEFNNLKNAEKFINSCINGSDKIANLQLVPYAIEPNVPKYLVSFYEFEESDKDL